MAKHHHTGRIRHGDMDTLKGSTGGVKDKHAHATHKAANKAEGMPQGMSPEGDYDGGHDTGGGGMAGNCCYED